jgi:hypothetical protein
LSNWKARIYGFDKIIDGWLEGRFRESVSKHVKGLNEVNLDGFVLYFLADPLGLQVDVSSLGV